ncbi:hypothetical protein OF83DRAFT_1167523 [Amylostereum chailletii]|nr:hypothetical protein OF83DRAFT_1167523 [Amylostereum chailletii]
MASSSSSPIEIPARAESPIIMNPLPSPHLRSQRSRQRLLKLPMPVPDSPPVPPTLVGSPLLDKFGAPRKRTQSLKPASLWADGDDFGARREKSTSLPPPSPSPSDTERRRTRSLHRRTSSISISASSSPRRNARARSPPPSPDPTSVPPPVPPLPDFVMSSCAHKSMLQPRSLNGPVPRIFIPDLGSSDPRHAPLKRRSSREAMTCIKFLSIHNPQPAVRAY